MRRLKKKNPVRHNKISMASGCCEKGIALAELVGIFTEEACKICKNRQIARLIALKALQEYVKKHTNNIKIVL